MTDLVTEFARQRREMQSRHAAEIQAHAAAFAELAAAQPSAEEVGAKITVPPPIAQTTPMEKKRFGVIKEFGLWIAAVLVVSVILQIAFDVMGDELSPVASVIWSVLIVGVGRFLYEKRNEV